MNRVRRTRPAVREIVVFENVQHLEQSSASGGRRRHRDNLTSTIVADERLANSGLVFLQVSFGDKPAVGFHICGDQLSGAPFVELARAVLFQSREGLAEL